VIRANTERTAILRTDELLTRAAERAEAETATGTAPEAEAAAETESEGSTLPGRRSGTGRARDRPSPVTLKTLLAAALILALAVFALHRAGLLIFPWEGKELYPIVAGDLFPGAGDAESGHLPGMTREEILAQMQKAADGAYFSFKINARPVFENGNAAGNLSIENPSYNVYPMVVQIHLDATGEIIYDSGGLYPDHHIASAKLSKALKAGKHNATAYMNAYDPDTLEWQGRQAAGLIITVLN
jgi:hypothetical protein